MSMVLVPSRNTIAFEWKNRDTIMKISNKYVKNQIKKMNCSNDSDNIIINSAKGYAIVSVNNQNISNNNIVETIVIDDIKYKIKRCIKTFHQADDTIREIIYNIINKIVKKTKSITFIGGEMYIYGKIINSEYKIFYSDVDSICKDTIINTFSNNVFFVNYSNVKLKYTDWLITNTSKNGLGNNLCKEILYNKFTNVIIISCNKKTLNNDYIQLKNIFKINKSFCAKTNYEVYVIWLKLRIV